MSKEKQEEQESSKKVAILVGNAQYAHLPNLLKPENEANDMANELTSRGYESNVLIDQTAASINKMWKTTVQNNSYNNQLTHKYVVFDPRLLERRVCF